MGNAVILTVDSQRASRATIRAILAPDGFDVVEADDAATALEALHAVSPDVVLLDVNLPGESGLELAGNIKEMLPHTPIIMITEARDNRVVVQAMRRGIYDYLTKPVNANDLRLAVSQGIEDKLLKDELRILRGRLEKRVALLTYMGDSPRVRALVGLLEKVAPTGFTVLIEGESGAGKELVARAIHDMSLAADGPFVPVDCGAIPETLFESELFGYAKGAFTGAVTSKAGFFEAAHRGTLFLDEVCNLSYTAQQKLLRVIEERRVQRLGSTASTPVNVRIISASNRPLEAEAEARLFRADLLYRLKEVSVRVPALRERPEDIYYLAQRFLNEFKEQIAVNCPGFSRQALDAMTAHSWPGNVRELRNIVRQAALSCEDGQVIAPQDLPFYVSTGTDEAGPDEAGVFAKEPRTGSAGARCFPAAGGRGEEDFLAALEAGCSMGDLVREYSGRLEAEIIRQALAGRNGNKAQAAKLLRTDYKTLYRKLKQYRK